MSERRQIFVLSDAMGSSGESVVRAALAQFGSDRAALRMIPRVLRTEDAERAVRLAAEQSAVVVHTLVNPSLRETVESLCRGWNVLSVDLIGALLGTLGDALGETPQAQPGRRFELDERYFRRVAAMEFAVKADDGQSPRLFDEADVVLVGVSRTSKTPLSTYLAGQGYKVANFPVVRGIEPPAELLALPAGKVFALTIDPVKLLEIRQARLAALGVEGSGDYADRSSVFAEVTWALRLYRDRTDWPIIDVTTRAVEETAGEIIRLRVELGLESALPGGGG
ncbi:MAG: kinase/pyrophosphorylase [Myxococcales bacterium]|nr:kinase/pyrophosphorylase [Myxococcales bacterium]MCB9519281.1 kinase/pyrophosphorylase [Myxococcales bacterium]MCB9530725.1 kinase/pyrophosphorylase [Myxococcales bacterium]MCB9533381.1 kinase/pyrophosphorylase [Myxococcales bacterium]